MSDSTNYAIAFDLDTAMLQQLYPNPSWNNAYADIKRTLEPLGFSRQQGSVYFGDGGSSVLAHAPSKRHSTSSSKPEEQSMACTKPLVRS